MKRYLQKLALWLFCSYCFCGCAHQPPRPLSNWATCEIDCAKDGSTLQGLAEDETKIYCLCERPAVGM